MVKNIKYTTARENKFYPLDWNNQLEQCCGCGLVHVVNYKVVKGQLFAKFKVDKKATAAIRINKK